MDLTICLENWIEASEQFVVDVSRAILFVEIWFLVVAAEFVVANFEFENYLLVEVSANPWEEQVSMGVDLTGLRFD